MMTGALARRAAGCLHRLPPVLGAVSRRRDVGGGNRRGRRQSRDHRRHLRRDGHGEHDGVRRRGARHDPARHRRDPGGPCRPAARRRGDRPRRRCSSPAAGSTPDRIVTRGFGRERAPGAAGDRRLDQRGPAPDRDRRARRDRPRPRTGSTGQRRNAGAGRSEADRPALHGGSVRRRRHRRGVARIAAAARTSIA